MLVVKPDAAIRRPAPDLARVVRAVDAGGEVRRPVSVTVEDLPPLEEPARIFGTPVLASSVIW